MIYEILFAKIGVNFDLCPNPFLVIPITVISYANVLNNSKRRIPHGVTVWWRKNWDLKVRAILLRF